MENNTYICVKPLPHIASEIELIVEMLGVNGAIPANEIHATLFTAQTGEDLETAPDILQPERKYTAKCVGVGILGEGDKKAMVIHLESPELSERHEELKILGPHSFPDFKPHISVKYRVTEEDEEIMKTLNKTISMVLPTVVLSGEAITTKEDPYVQQED